MQGVAIRPDLRGLEKGRRRIDVGMTVKKRNRLSQLLIVVGAWKTADRV